MRWSRLALMVVTSFMGSGFWTVPAHAAAPPETATVTVLVARSDIPCGVVLREPEKLFRRARYVKGSEPRQALTSFAQLKGKITRRALAEDQPVKAKDVGPLPPAVELPFGTYRVKVTFQPIAKGSKEKVQADRKPPNEGSFSFGVEIVGNGKVARANRTTHNEVTIRHLQHAPPTANELILPGVRVDVLLWYKREPKKEVEARILIQNVLVLEATQGALLLALKPEEALRLLLAGEVGTIRVIVRPSAVR